MSTYRELAYMIMDELKLSSDDSYYTEEHIYFLMDKYRGFLLRQKYSDVRKDIPESNYQTVCVDLIEVPAIPEVECEGGDYLRSTAKIPHLLTIGAPKVYPTDYFSSEHISIVSMQRLRYVGYNKWLPNIIYCALGPDNYLYFKSNNPQFLHLKKAKITGIFEDSEKAQSLNCEGEEQNCDISENKFPLEESLIPLLIQSVVKELSGAVYRPKDNINDASDDLSAIRAFIRNNMKSNLQKQIDGDDQ